MNWTEKCMIRSWFCRLYKVVSRPDLAQNRFVNPILIFVLFRKSLGLLTALERSSNSQIPAKSREECTATTFSQELPLRTEKRYLFLRCRKTFYFCFIDYAKTIDRVGCNKLWKILKEMGIPDHLTCLLRNLYAGQEATVRAGHGATDWIQIGKGVRQGCILLPCLYAEYIMRNAGLDEAQVGIKIVGEISITSDMQMTLHLWQKAKKN